MATSAEATRAADQITFAHNSERQFARLLDFYRVEWEYEPTAFPIEWDAAGRPTQQFRPDFYLPGFGLYIEITTLNQRLVTKKNRKVRRLRELYPDVRIKVLYQRDYLSLLAKYGLEPPSQMLEEAPRAAELAGVVEGARAAGRPPTQAGGVVEGSAGRATATQGSGRGRRRRADGGTGAEGAGWGGGAGAGGRTAAGAAGPAAAGAAAARRPRARPPGPGAPAGRAGAAARSPRRAGRLTLTSHRRVGPDSRLVESVRGVRRCGGSEAVVQSPRPGRVAGRWPEPCGYVEKTLSRQVAMSIPPGGGAGEVPRRRVGRVRRSG